MGHAIAGVFGSLFGVALAITPVVLAALLTRHDPAVARILVLLVCAAGDGLVLAWLASASRPAWPRRGCRSCTRSPCAASCSQ